MGSTIKNNMKELEKHQNEILNTRVGGLGGSDARLVASIANKGIDNLSATNARRLATMLDLLPPVTIPVTPAMAAGHLFEDYYDDVVKGDIEVVPGIVDSCYLREDDIDGESYTREEYLQHQGGLKNFKAFAHADYTYHYDGGFDVYELKFVNGKTIDEVAQTYYWQLQWYYMLGAAKVRLVHGIGNVDPFKVKGVQFKLIDKDEVAIETLKKGLQILDDAIESGWEPTLRTEEKAEDTILLDDINEMESLLRQKEEIDSKIATIKERLMEYMMISGVDKIQCPQGNLSYSKPTITRTIDSKRLKAEHKDIYDAYLVENERKGSVTYKFTKKIL